MVENPTHPVKMYFGVALDAQAQYHGLMVILSTQIPEGFHPQVGDPVHISYKLSADDIQMITREIALHPERTTNPDRRTEVWPITHQSQKEE